MTIYLITYIHACSGFGVVQGLSCSSCLADRRVVAVPDGIREVGGLTTVTVPIPQVYVCFFKSRVRRLCRHPILL